MSNIKPKRGHSFIIKETGETVYLERIKSNTVYFVCDTAGLPLHGNYFDVKVEILAENKKSLKSLIIGSKPETVKQKTDRQILNEFFTNVALTMPFNCMECGKPLYAYNQFAKRCVSAHILPKAEFESVKTNPDNIFFLGADLLGICSCHDDWDRKGADHRANMAVYQIALERFETSLKHKLTGHELIRAYTYLNLKFT